MTSTSKESNDKRRCEIPARTLPPCDLEWGHDGDMHCNGGDGFYAAQHRDEHHQAERKVLSASCPDIEAVIVLLAERIRDRHFNVRNTLDRTDRGLFDELAQAVDQLRVAQGRDGANWLPPASIADRQRARQPVVCATDVECPTCFAWVGWACEGDDYGYHAAGYHPARQNDAERMARKKETP